MGEGQQKYHKLLYVRVINWVVLGMQILLIILQKIWPKKFSYWSVYLWFVLTLVSEPPDKTKYSSESYLIEYV